MDVLDSSILSKMPILSFSERLVYFFASAILYLVLFTFCKLCQQWTILSFLKSGLHIIRWVRHTMCSDVSNCFVFSFVLC